TRESLSASRPPASRPRPTGGTSSGCRTASRPSIGAARTWPAFSRSLGPGPHRARPPSSGRGGLTAGMPLTLPANGGQSAVQAVAVVPEESVAALVDLAGPLLGVDHEQPAWADDEVVDVGGGARKGQVVQDLGSRRGRGGRAAARSVVRRGRRAARRGPARRGGSAAASRLARPRPAR